MMPAVHFFTVPRLSRGAGFGANVAHQRQEGRQVPQVPPAVTRPAQFDNGRRIVGRTRPTAEAWLEPKRPAMAVWRRSASEHRTGHSGCRLRRPCRPFSPDDFGRFDRDLLTGGLLPTSFVIGLSSSKRLGRVPSRRTTVGLPQVVPFIFLTRPKSGNMLKPWGQGRDPARSRPADGNGGAALLQMAAQHDVGGLCRAPARGPRLVLSVVAEPDGGVESVGQRRPSNEGAQSSNAGGSASMAATSARSGV